MSLVGNAYIQPSSQDPGSVGFGYDWVQTDTANVYTRNTANTAWTYVGNANQTNMGMLSKAGGTMTGAILGAHGLMPTAGGNFTVAPTIGGAEIATKFYVDEQDKVTQEMISEEVAKAMASQPSLSVNNKVTYLSGISDPLVVNGTFTIPLPSYADGTVASEAEVDGKYVAWFEGGVTDMVTNMGVTQVSGRTYRIFADNTTVPASAVYTIGWSIMAIRQ